MSQYEQDITSPGYKEHEMSYLNRIPDPAATTKMEQVQELFIQLQVMVKKTTCAD